MSYGNTGNVPTDAQTVIPSDTQNLPRTGSCIGFYVGKGGDVRVRTHRNTDITYKNVQDGSVIEGRFKRIFDTGTKAKFILALY